MGCGAVRPQPELRRVVLAAGRLRPDDARRGPGRGAYVCGRECAERAVARNGFQRSFRSPILRPQDLLDSL